MTERNISSQSENPISFRVFLLAAQILIPFGLYWAMNRASPLGMGICAALYLLSMGVLVWMK